jgi:hypothetical protein
MMCLIQTMVVRLARGVKEVSFHCEYPTAGRVVVGSPWLPQAEVTPGNRASLVGNSCSGNVSAPASGLERSHEYVCYEYQVVVAFTDRAPS